MRRRHLFRALAPAAAVLLAAACADTATAPDASPHKPNGDLVIHTLAWFGYAPSDNGSEAVLAGTESYTNFGFVSVDSNDPNSTTASAGIYALRTHARVAVVELGALLWCPAFPNDQDLRQLCPNRASRWQAWKQANWNELNSGAVLGFIVRDEPFVHGVDADSVQAAAAMVKADFPNARIILIEAAVVASGDHPASAAFAASAGRITSVDWVGVDIYGILHPATDDTLRRGVDGMKAKFPGKGFVYVADGWNGGVGATPGVMTEWYNKARQDPQAVLLGVFDWASSKDFAPSVFAEQIAAGRAITGRTRTQGYAPTGAFEGIDAWGNAVGWACDPDGAWNESVRVDFYSNGSYIGYGKADQPDGGSHVAECRSGNAHRFSVPLYYTTNVTAVARDLDSGSTTLAGPSTSIAWVMPSGVTWGAPNTLTVAGYASGGTGGVKLTWRDASVGGGWNVEGWQPAPDASHAWSNTLPSSNYCHDYEVYSTFNGITSSVFTYHGLTSGYCNEQARVIWIQPQSSAGFGPAGSLVVAGSATGAPAGTTVTMYWRDATAGGGWNQAPYSAPTDGGGIWYNAIDNANPYHQYQVTVRYDVLDSATCTYAGTNSITWC